MCRQLKFGHWQLSQPALTDGSSKQARSTSFSRSLKTERYLTTGDVASVKLRFAGKSLNETTPLPKLAEAAVGRLFRFADGFLIVGGVDDCNA
jgi:hypothetical protein